MEKEKKRDRRYRKTEKAIQEAYFSLVKEKKSQITVAEIARRADIDRKTFYLHYDTPEEVLVRFCQERLSRLNEILQKENFLRSPSYIRGAFSMLNEVLEEDMDIYREISTGTIYNFFWERVENTFKKAVYAMFRNHFEAEEDELALMLVFYTSGIIAAYRKWLSGELQGSLDVIADKIAFLSMQGISGYLKTAEV